MAVNIVVPSFGESISEGTISQWKKKEGDYVNKDDIVLEIESEKATQGIPSPASGILHPKANEGEKVEVGGVIGTIDETANPGNQRSEPAQAPLPKKSASEHSEPSKPQPTKSAIQHSEPARSDSPPLSPTARRAARRTGEHTAKPAPNHSSTEPPEHRVPMTAIRARIAERLVTSQKSTASLTTFNEIDMSAVMDLRSRYKDKFKELHGVNLGFMSFFVKASIEALKAFPLANAAMDGRDIVYHDHYHVGVAVSTDKGLMVPVLRDAQEMTFAEIENAISNLAVKARDGKISVSDLQGGTFTITNGGTFGSMMSTPILNYPQAAILGMHAIQKRPVVRNDQVVVRPMMYVALTYDHRLIDGRDAVLFLVRIKDCIEDPQRLLISV